MKQKINKIAVVFVVSIFALTTLGVAYAAWTDTLYINGTVTTGKVCWEFTTCSLLDEIPPINPGGDYVGMGNPLADYTCRNNFADPPPLFWRGDKNVAWGTQQIKDNDGDGCKETLEVTLHNAYPCYFNSVSFYVRNCGTIPIKVWYAEINGVKYYTYFYTALDLNNDGENDVEIRYGNGWGTQIEPGVNSLHEFSFWIHVLQPCPQNQLDTLHFTISLGCIQWNEYVSGPLP
ncbi:MAG: hypothetical protein ACQXXD_06460 [Thermoplasmatota archaeon]